MIERSFFSCGKNEGAASSFDTVSFGIGATRTPFASFPQGVSFSALPVLAAPADTFFSASANKRVAGVLGSAEGMTLEAGNRG